MSLSFPFIWTRTNRQIISAMKRYAYTSSVSGRMPYISDFFVLERIIDPQAHPALKKIYEIALQVFQNDQVFKNTSLFITNKHGRPRNPA